MRTRFIALLLLASSLPVSAQRITDPNANLWVSHWGDQRLSDRWSLHTEGHWRRANLGKDWQQLLLRPAINFHLNEQLLLTQGYSYYFNYAYGDHPARYQNWEHHLYQQLQISNHGIGRARLQHRFRMEERFLARMKAAADSPGDAVLDGYRYQSRFRYRVWVTIPLGHEHVEPGVFSAQFYDEVFLSFGDSQLLDYIQQNRISAMLGYQVSKPVSILAGYLYQTIQKPGGAMGADLIELNSTVHLALVCNLDLRKPKTSPQ
ncbi:MAG TPA: DUF2490 domain-containing protein [Flavobacteriales bacterium]|nr:DUF2490 domain-containing protein [Flavobacteriales bacterium]